MEVSLNKDGWHRKLQVWTFGSKTPNFNSLCPFFWLTVFCLLVSPVVAAVKYGVVLPVRLLIAGLESAVGLLLKGVELCVDAFNTGVCQPIYEQRVESVSSSLTDDEAYELYRRVCFIDEHPVDNFSLNYVGSWSYKDRHDRTELKRSAAVALDQLKAWQNKNPDWATRLAAANERRKEAQKLLFAQLEKENAEKKAREERLKKFFNAIALYTKYPISLVLGVVAIYLVYGLALLGLWLYECSGSIANFFKLAFQWVVSVIVERGPLVLGVMVGLLALVALVVLSVKLLSKCTLFHTGKQGRLSKAMSKFGDGVYSFVEFFVMYAKAAKQNYCPRINWK